MGLPCHKERVRHLPLTDRAPFRVTRVEEHNGTVKLAVAVGNLAGVPLEAEAVLLRMEGYTGTRWYTLCVSSQIGCRVGCPFCETGRMGLLQNLSADAIVAQYLIARQRVEAVGASIRNLVFMGMGEPLDNLDAVIEGLRVLNNPAGLAIPLSRVTLSTVGRAAGLARLAALAQAAPWSDLRLAISLHALTDALRNRLVPANRAMPLDALRQALCAYPLKRRGRFLLQYTLLRGVNDSRTDAEALAAWCAPLRCTVNLLAYNPQREARWESPAPEVVNAFLDHLRRADVRAKYRHSHGTELFAGCGQLGNRALKSGLQKALESDLRSTHVS